MNKTERAIRARETRSRNHARTKEIAERPVSKAKQVADAKAETKK